MEIGAFFICDFAVAEIFSISGIATDIPLSKPPVTFGM